MLSSNLRIEENNDNTILILQIKENSNKLKSSSENDDEDEEGKVQVWGRKFNISLLDQHTELKKMAEGNVYVKTR